MTANTDQVALTLLLRSPHLTLSTILDLLDLSDADFRRLAADSGRIKHLLTLRQAGRLEQTAIRPRPCPVCAQWFEPYASERYCSDACKSIGRLERKRARARHAPQTTH